MSKITPGIKTDIFRQYVNLVGIHAQLKWRSKTKDCANISGERLFPCK